MQGWGYWREQLAWTLITAGFWVLLEVSGATADEGLGAYLASECTSCHRQDRGDHGIPSIAGREEDDFIAAMRAYKTGERENQVMRSVARALSEEEIAALADYFSTLKPEGKLQ